jgi:hypothetical protein
LDVKNAFLHGSLSEEVYMDQPPGYTDPRFPNHVCRLHKAIYELKQAPRAWFHRFNSFLLQYGFTCSHADYSFFVFHKPAGIIYLLLHVDDIVLTGNNPSLLQKFTAHLSREFSMNDLGPLHYFLGIEVQHTSTGLFLSQIKYALDLLKRVEMANYKPITTSMVVGQRLSAVGASFSDSTLYRSIVGALQYLVITHPDLAHSVNTVCQFMHTPTEDHFRTVKRILRYVKGTLSFSLTISSHSSSNILAYSDADWAGCLDNRRSTSGYAIFLDNNFIYWSAKKKSTISRSSAESKYRSLALTAAEVTWLTHLLKDLRISSSSPATILCDNRNAIFMSANPVSHARSKHIALDYHFVREQVAAGVVRVQFVTSQFQIADLFKKSLPRS